MTYKYNYSNEETILPHLWTHCREVLLNVYGCNLKLRLKISLSILNWILHDGVDFPRDICGIGEVEIWDVTLFWAEASDITSVYTSFQSS
jgi:hypothetical protein